MIDTKTSSRKDRFFSFFSRYEFMSVMLFFMMSLSQYVESANVVT